MRHFGEYFYSPSPITKVALVINPMSKNTARAIDEVFAQCARSAIAPPQLYRTTPGRLGQECSAEAVANGADLVIAAGGDGAVRAVASQLVDTDVKLAVLALGTAIILAANLGITRLPIVRQIDVA